MKNNKIPKKLAVPKTKGTNTNAWIILGISAVVIGGVGYWYYKKKKKDGELGSLELATMTSGGVSTSTSKPNGNTGTPSRVRFRCMSKDYPLQYGTCHKDVKVLQAYLKKTYNAALGASGPGRDGIDGMFGNKTNIAAKKYLGKAAFTKNDIQGMRTANKLVSRKPIKI